MHIDSALAGVPDDERCPGWRTGKCSAGSGSSVDFTCPDCGMSMKASSDALMKEIVDAHNKVGGDGLSQCTRGA